MQSRRRAYLLNIPFTIWFVGFLLAPLGLIIATSLAHRTPLGTIEPALEFDSYCQLLDPLYAGILVRTVMMAAANTALTLLVAYPVAFVLSRLPDRARNIVLTLVLIPFWTNYLVRVLAFMDVLRWKPFGLEWTYTGKGVLAALVYNYLPFAVLPLFSSMRAIDNSVLEAARDLGASTWQVFRKVLWPLTRTGTIAAAALVFIPTLGEFLIPDLVGGGRFFVMGTFLQNQFLTARNWPLGSAAIVLLSAATLLPLLLDRRRRAQ